ncbi:5545_t:CDS:2 [Funneliformis caledonium]|uniref:5545_t:CDS:1 n=1 Tax=Funneliformis caledonium TaxID=1117310 RepID=A0A9N9H772_9GLOM|nr:5545_t:CDS:2 [Funneliformis caledonium]
MGGFPQFVLEQADKEEHQKQLDKAIKKCNMDIFNYIGDSTGTDVSHKLVHIYTNFPFTYEEVVKDENEMDLDLVQVIFMLDRDGTNLRTETFLSLKSGISNSLLGISFEQIAHQVLRDGGIFKTHSLGFNDIEETSLLTGRMTFLKVISV